MSKQLILNYLKTFFLLWALTPSHLISKEVVSLFLRTAEIDGCTFQTNRRALSLWCGIVFVTNFEIYFRTLGSLKLLGLQNYNFERILLVALTISNSSQIKLVVKCVWHFFSLSGWVPLGDSVRNVGSLKKGNQHWRRERRVSDTYHNPSSVASLLSSQLNHPLYPVKIRLEENKSAGLIVSLQFFSVDMCVNSAACFPALLIFLCNSR